MARLNLINCMTEGGETNEYKFLNMLLKTKKKF